MPIKTQVNIIPKLMPLFDFSQKRRVRACFGGRGSGKTRSFALMSAVRGLWFASRGIKGTILCARQFQNSLAESSFEEVKRAIEAYPFLAEFYEIGDSYIKSRDGAISYSFLGLARNINSVKSMGRILLAWVDEAEPVTEEAWRTLIPTLREEGDGWQAELWVTWNPMRENAAVEQRFRSNALQINWQDNPCFPATLNEARLDDLQNRPEYYAHIWEGAYLRAAEGAYFSAELARAREEGRIGFVALDPLYPVRCFWDIGGTGAGADATAIWVAQFIGKQILVCDYYEAQGQALSAHVDWLRKNGYGRAQQILPHDGRTQDRVHAASFETALWDAGFDVEVVPNQGKGAARLRIEAVRRLMPCIWFHEEKCKAGLDALSWYHEKRDEIRGIGLGPCHDWASHAADAFGLLCCKYEQPNSAKKPSRYQTFEQSSTSWMAL